ncbi:MAG: 8-amino-7-oxononanoate synthase [Pirellulaceae bacterium]|nr:8-amino-7-oxononanoate synthase [Pirellulaceae bacterium]MDP7019100.1 8-amino-7-oxononanoate synthase [Pirellulaceae bacterium]
MTNDPLAWIDAELIALERRGLRRELFDRGGPQSPRGIEIAGRRVINFGSNDYLGLAARLTAAVRGALGPHGWGSGASPLLSGRSSAHADLEAAIAQFEAVPAARLFPSGYAANCGSLAALVKRGDAVFSDAKNHASIIDGCRLSRADVHIYNHADVDSLNAALASAREAPRKLIVTDSLFSMDGDVAPLPQIVELAELHRAMVMVDEAHATGVFGRCGRGVCEALGVEDGVHLRVGTLSKALGSIGGFVCGEERVIEWLTNRARPYFFSTAPPAAASAAGIMALGLVRESQQQREDLLRRAEQLRASIAELGWTTGASTSQIIPIYVGQPQTAMQLANQLYSAGVFAPGIRPPTVPNGESLLRISLCEPHTDDDVARLLDALGPNAEKLNSSN